MEDDISGVYAAMRRLNDERNTPVSVIKSPDAPGANHGSQRILYLFLQRGKKLMNATGIVTIIPTKAWNPVPDTKL